MAKDYLTREELILLEDYGWGGALSGMGKGAAAGAAAGSFFAPIGTVIGGAVGAIGGGLIGHFKEEKQIKYWLWQKSTMLMVFSLAISIVITPIG